jgi:hypothetical protein
MATQNKKPAFPEFFADTKSADNLRRQFIEAPMEGAAQQALGAGIELANLLSILPGAFVASQQKELERIKQSKVENDPRVAALEASIEQATVLQTMAQRGQVRAQRALVAVASQENVFHGFVSDAELTPLKGLTVRVTGGKRGNAGALSATTDDDGYFSIALGTRSERPAASRLKTGKGLVQRVTDLMMSPGIARLTAEPKSAEGEGAQVEILRKSTVLHTDPASLNVERGTVYREYVVADTEPSSASDLKNFAASVSAKVTAEPPQQKKATKATKKSASKK